MEEKSKILIIEDNAILLDAVEYIVTHAGYQVFTARDSEAAVTVFRKEQPDLVVINPSIKGLHQSTLYQEFKKCSGVFDVPMIILPPSGFSGGNDFSPAHMVIRPPVEDGKLIAGIKELLSNAYDFKNTGSGKKILLAVDHQDVLTSMSDQLQKIGWETEVIRSGLYVIAQAVQFEPDLIILDLELSEFRPQDSIQILRTFLQFQGIPIILLTSYHISHLGAEDLHQKMAETETLRKRCMNVGATEYIGRFNENSFLKLIKNYIHS